MKDYFYDTRHFNSATIKRAKIINTGSTFAYQNIDYSYFDIIGFNMALQPQSISYDYKLLKKFSCYINNESIVLLVIIAPFVFFVDNYSDDRINYRYYKILSNNDILNYSALKSIYVNTSSFIMKYPQKLFKIVFGTFPDKTDNNEVDLIIEKTSMNRINGWKEQFMIDDFFQFISLNEYNNTIEKNISILRNMISFCLESNWNPVLINMPVTNNMKKHFSTEFIQSCYYDHVKKANIQKIPFLDYFSDSRFDDLIHFQSADSLNSSGKFFLTKLIQNDLHSLGLL